MQYAETILSFVVGLAAAGLLAVVFSLKIKGFTKLLINAFAGCAALLLLSCFKVTGFSLNPLSAFLVGFAGVPGLGVVYVIVTFL